MSIRADDVERPSNRRRQRIREARRRKQLRAAQARYERTPRGKYQQHKENARKRRIAFELTFEQWLDVWVSSGHFDERSNKTADGYVMARKGDRGPYAVGNVEIVPHRVNIAERNRNFAYAKRAGIPWDWLKNAPAEPELPDPDVPF